MSQGGSMHRDQASLVRWSCDEVERLGIVDGGDSSEFVRSNVFASSILCSAVKTTLIARALPLMTATICSIF